jgi:hypothetical protein
MNTSPLLPSNIVEQVAELLKIENTKNEIIDLLNALPLEERIHILRFLYWNNICDASRIYDVWGAFIALDHPLNTKENRLMLNEISGWWDAFGKSHAMMEKDYDELERSLDMLGATPEGRDYFRWVALYPVGIEQRHHKWAVWDDERRGAIICLAKYAYSKDMECFLARHLDDWCLIQADVAEILVGMRSRVLAKVASWYLMHNEDLKPVLEKYGFEAI